MRQHIRLLNPGIAIAVLLLALVSPQPAVPDAGFSDIDGFVRAQRVQHRISVLAPAITQGGSSK